MDLILGRLSQLEQRALAQDLTIARLSAENEVQTATITRLSAQNAQLSGTVTRLSSEADQHRNFVSLVAHDHHKNLREMSMAMPGGHWMWEGKGPRQREGRWVWSLEDYKPVPGSLSHTGRPASLGSLPFEVLEVIASFVHQNKGSKTLALTSFRYLEAASKQVYKDVTFNMDRAIRFFSPRVLDGRVRSDRISKLLVPVTVRLAGLSTYTRLFPGPLALGQINISTLIVALDNDSAGASLARWALVMRTFNPSGVQFWRGSRPDLFPTQTRVATLHTFYSGWNRLSFAAFVGQGALLVQGTPTRPSGSVWLYGSAWRGAPSARPVPSQTLLMVELVDGSRSSRLLDARYAVEDWPHLSENLIVQLLNGRPRTHVRSLWLQIEVKTVV